MGTQGPTNPDTTPSELSNQSFALRRRQRIGIGVLAFLVVALGVVLFKEIASRRVEAPALFSGTIGAYTNVHIAEEKSLDFVVAFQGWLGGTVTRENLDRRRALLATQLAQPDNLGIPSGERFGTGYFHALGVLDGYVKGVQSGFLPLVDQVGLRLESSGPLNAFLYESRRPSARISEGGDAQVYALFRDEISRLRNLDVTVWALLVFIFLLAGTLAVSHIRTFREIGIQMNTERRELEEERAARQRADESLEARIAKDRMDRLDREWIDSAVNSILLQMKETVGPDEIADLLVEGVGRTVDADYVLYFAAGESQTQELWKQWYRRTDFQIDLSRLPEYEANMTDLAKFLEKRSRVIAVDDSSLINISRHPFPRLATMSQEIARSWMLAPIGEAAHGLGYVWIAMAKDARVWSAAEVGFVKKIVADSAQVLAHAWMMSQSMQIAEHDAEVARLVELDKVKNDFIENMNHELRTPLTSIIGYLEVIKDDVDIRSDPELASSLMAMQRNASRLQILIENMMQLSKTDLDILPLIVSTVDIGHLLGDVVNSLHLVAEDCQVVMTLRLDSPAGDLIIDGDVGQLEQVFVNLVQNAIKFTRPKGTVTVVARRFHADGDFVEVKVIDTGIGIPSDEFPNVFKRFFRASTATKASIGGFGIGLSLVYSIVSQHHGTVTFDSTVGKGTVFTVTLPTRYVLSKPVSEIPVP